MRPEVLDLDWYGGGRAERVTRLLQACVPGAGDEVWRWTLHQRTQALLALDLAADEPRTTLTARCSRESCGQPMELEVDLSAFVLGERPQQLAWRTEAGTELVLRVPRGEDHQRWEAADAPPSAAAIAQTLLASEIEIRPQWLEPLGEALEELDPLNVLTLAAMCPACGAQSEMALDLEALLLERAAARRERLIDVVHRIARAYHWSEAEILALPPARRTLYLERIEREIAP
jgi:hypothetical protein